MAPRAGAASVDRPPPPHDPWERGLVARIGAWEVRRFEPEDLKFGYFLARGFLHLQLWHPEAPASVLTPSRLTGGFFEVFPIDGWKARVTAGVLHRIVARELGVRLPSLTRIAAATEWHLHALVRRTRRLSAAADRLVTACDSTRS